MQLKLIALHIIYRDESKDFYYFVNVRHSSAVSETFTETVKGTVRPHRTVRYQDHLIFW